MAQTSGCIEEPTRDQMTDLLGKVVQARVKAVSRYRVHLESVGLPVTNAAYLQQDRHGSSPAEPPCPGQAVAVQVIAYSRKYAAWEVRPASSIDRGEQATPLRGVDHEATVTKACQSGVYVRLANGVPCRIDRKQGDVLLGMGTVQPGDPVQVRVIYVPPGGRLPMGRICPGIRIDKGQILEATVFGLADPCSHPHYYPKGSKSRAPLVVALHGRFTVLLCDTSGWLEPSKAFLKGFDIQVQMLRVAYGHHGVYRGRALATGALADYVPVRPKIGGEMDVCITSVANFGAFFTLPGHEDGMIHFQSLTDSEQPDLTQQLKPGDVVRVRCRHPDRQGHLFGWDYVRLLHRADQDIDTPDADRIPEG